MTDKRKFQIPVFPYILFIVSLAVLIAGALIYVNFPSKTTAAWGTIAAGVVIALTSFAMRPAMVSEIFASRKTLLWVNDVVLILVIIGIGVVISHIGFRRNVRYDFTQNQMFSLSDITIKTVRSLAKDVKVTAFFPRGVAEENMLKELLQEYKRHSDRFSFTMVDPMRDPVTTRAMNVSSIGTVVVQCEANRHDVNSKDLFEMPNQFSPPGSKPKFAGEQVLTSAIINVTSGVKRLITFVKGHGESSIGGFQGRDITGVNELLTGENFDVEELSLVEADIDPRTSVLAIVSPQQDFLDNEIEKIRAFMKENKGNLVVALDPGRSLEKIEKFLHSDFGVAINNDIVVDPRGIQRNYWTVAPELGEHAITAPIKAKSMLSLMFHCRSINLESKDGYKADPFLKTIENSWAKRGLKDGEQISLGFEEGRDVKGPFNLGVAIEHTAVASGSKILVYGDSDFFSNSLIGSLANRDLFINGINWLVGQHQMISIRPRILEVPRIVLDEKDAGRIFSICVFGAPALVIMLGLCVYLYRRRV